MEDFPRQSETHDSPRTAAAKLPRGRGVVQRVSYGFSAILLIVAVVLLDAMIARTASNSSGALAELLARGSLLPLVCIAVVLAGAIEFMRLLRAKGAKPCAAFALSMIAALMLAPWLSAAGWLGSGPAQVEGLYCQIVLLAAAFLGSSICLVARSDPEGSMRDLGATVFTIFYFGFMGSFAIQLRCGQDTPGQDGAWLFLVVLLVTKCSDIGAYFVGMALGRHKLAPRISPGKTVEGMVGGLVASAGVAVVLVSLGKISARAGLEGSYLELARQISAAFASSDNTGSIPPVVWAFFFGLALSAAGQLGDLVESCFKRDAGAKDSGNLIPRFGGILDLIDSPLLALPVAWVLLTVW